MQRIKREDIIYTLQSNWITIKPDFVLVKLFNGSNLRSHSCRSIAHARQIIERYKINNEDIEVKGCSWQREQGWCIQLTKQQMRNVEDRIDAGIWHRD